MLGCEGSAPSPKKGQLWRATSELFKGHQLIPWPECITTQLLFGLILFLFLLPVGVDTKGTPNKPTPVIPERPIWDLTYPLDLLEHFSSSQNQECSHYNLFYNSFRSMYLKGQLNTLQILLHMLGSQHISDKTYSLPRTHFSTSSIYKPLFPLSLFISRYMYIHIVHIFFPKFLFKNFLSVEKLRPRTKTICTILTETHHLVISHHTLSSTFC